LKATVPLGLVMFSTGSLVLAYLTDSKEQLCERNENFNKAWIGEFSRIDKIKESKNDKI
jgi:hypothetical protein